MNTSLPPQEKQKLSEMVKFFSRAVNQTRDFGSTHPLAKASIERCFTLLNQLLTEKREIILYIAEQKIRYEEEVLEEKNIVVDKMIDFFLSIKLYSLEFVQGFTQEEFIMFLNILSQKAEDILSAGGIEELVKQANIVHLSLNPIKYKLIGKDEEIVAKDRGVIEGEEKEEDLLLLVDGSLKEKDNSLFMDKLLKDPLQGVYAIIEAMRILNKIEKEKARVLILSIINKLNHFRDMLYEFLSLEEDNEQTAHTYHCAEILGKELSRQLKKIEVLPEFEESLEHIQTILRMILDQTEARKLLRDFLKGKQTLRKKAIFLKRVKQREKTSSDFEYFIKRMLRLKGMSEEEVEQLFAQRSLILEQARKEKEREIRQQLFSILEKLFQHTLTPSQALEEIEKVVEELIRLKKKQRNAI